MFKFNLKKYFTEKNKGRNIEAVDKLTEEVNHDDTDAAAAKEEVEDDESAYSNESESSSSNESLADSDSDTSSNVKSKNRKNENLSKSKVPAKTNSKPPSISTSKNVTTNKAIGILVYTFKLKFIKQFIYNYS